MGAACCAGGCAGPARSPNAGGANAQAPIRRSGSRHGRVSATSAVAASPVRRRPGLCFRLPPGNRGAKAEGTAASLKDLRRPRRGPMTIARDRSVIHGRSRLVRAWLKRHRTVVAERFPGYAPELNPGEHVWPHTKYAELRNCAAPDLNALRGAVDGHLRSLHQGKELLRGSIDHAHLVWGKRSPLYLCRTQ